MCISPSPLHGLASTFFRTFSPQPFRGGGAERPRMLQPNRTHAYHANAWSHSKHTSQQARACAAKCFAKTHIPDRITELGFEAAAFGEVWRRLFCVGKGAILPAAVRYVPSFTYPLPRCAALARTFFRTFSPGSPKTPPPTESTKTKTSEHCARARNARRRYLSRLDGRCVSIFVCCGVV